MIITIDGPVASGKSAVARLLAKKQGLYYINSGLLFRAIAYLLTDRCNIPVEQLVTFAHDPIISCIDARKLEYEYADGQESVIYDGQNITWFLKTSEIDHAASLAGTNPDIREIILQVERKLAENHNVVIDGRDTGSVVFPKADLKIYLTASPEIRAERWQNDQEKKGNSVSLSESLSEISQRDERDKTRLVAPLVKPVGAVIVDSSEKSIKDVVCQIEKSLSSI